MQVFTQKNFSVKKILCVRTSQLEIIMVFPVAPGFLKSGSVCQIERNVAHLYKILMNLNQGTWIKNPRNKN